MQKEYNIYALEALSRARTDAQACHQKYVGTEHILLGLLAGEQTLAGRVLKENGLTYQAFFDAVLAQSAALGDMGRLPFSGYSPKAKRILEESEEDAARFDSHEIGTEHILLSLLREKDCIAARLLKSLAVNVKKIYVDILVTLGMDTNSAIREYQFVTGTAQGKNQVMMTDVYCDDLTERAREGSLDPIVGRKEEMTRLIQIMGRSMPRAMANTVFLDSATLTTDPLSRRFAL